MASARSPRLRLAVAVMAVVVLVGGAVAATLRPPGEGTAPAPGSDREPAAPTTMAPALPTAQARTVQTLKDQVSDIRGLEWKADLPIAVVTPEEIAHRVRQLNAEEMEEDREDLEAAETILKLLGLIPADVDYESTIDDILAGGVLGFYDDEAKELFVGGDPDGDLDAATRSTMVHELTHALTDQHFGFGARYEELSEADRTEESYALTALVEGDAELVRHLWERQNLTPVERLEADLAEGADPDVLDGVPQYILASLVFPYVGGLDFVTALHEKGGFPLIDVAYRQPPTSSEDILHPDRYVPGRSWTSPSLPDLAAATGCSRLDTGAVGEFDMLQVLDLHLAEGQARQAAEGWDGDAYEVVRCGSAVGMADRWRTDTDADADELAGALAQWAGRWSGSGRQPDDDGRFSGPNGAGHVVRGDGRVDLVVAQDTATADRLAAALASTP